MQLSKYISELLYRYDCVMVPNFGGFVSNTVSSKINTEHHQFTPPSKSISFNVNLQQNDGLLTNHVATAINVSYDTAAELIQKQVEAWNKDLKSAPLLLDKIGQFSLVEGQLVFEPVDKINYLTSSFGLSDVDANYILRHNINVVEEEVVAKKSYGKYAAAAAIAVGLFLGGSTYVNHVQSQEDVIAQKNVTTQIQQASFNILKPLPGVTLTVAKEATVEEVNAAYKYHVVAGAFKAAANAEKKVAQLKQKGYDARIIGVNKWGLTQVVYQSYASKREAINALNKVKREDNKYAWLLVNK